jgi:hypothetical protein
MNLKREQMRSANNRYIDGCIQSQRKEELARRRSEYEQRFRKYNKPHFGPEQTDDSLTQDDKMRKTKTNFANASLKKQISDNSKMRS